MENYRNKAFRGFVSQTFVTVAYGILSLGYFSVMSRLLTKEEFGLYAVVTAIIAVIESISEAGIGSAIIQNKNANSTYVSTAFSLSVILGLVFSLLVFVMAPLLSMMTVGSKILMLPIRIMALSVLLTSLVGVFKATYMKKLNFLKYGLIQNLIYLVSSPIGILLAYRGYGIYAPIMACILNQTGLAALLWLMANVKVKFVVDRKYVGQILTYGGWLTGSVIVRVVNDQIDKLLMPKLLSVTQLGTYNRPSGFIGQISNHFFGIFDTILFPILSDMQDDRNKVKEAYGQIFNLLILLSLALSFSLILLSDIVIDVFLGKQWESLDLLLHVLSLGIIFGAYRRICDCFFRSLGYMKPYFVLRCISSVVTIAAVVVGCRGGIVGVALAVVVAQFLDALFKICYLNRAISYRMWDFVKNLFATAAIPVLVFLPCHFMRSALGWNSILCFAIFALLMIGLPLMFPMCYGRAFHEHVYVPAMGKVKKILGRG